jgi:GDP/UDP-N,N'-diacetylbacillosamine 2-epimerase (hydrolysing)
MKNICVVTGTRADYGLLYWLLKEIDGAKEFNLQIIATGMHLSEKFGNTWKNIEDDSFTISKKVDLGEHTDSRSSIASQVGNGVKRFFSAFEELKPDLILVLGDRYEILAAAQSAVFKGIPIAHLCGGEITEGAFDDIIRHSITKMSSFHFTATDEYKKRVIQMGEKPESVFTVGAPGLDNIRKLKLLPQNEIEKQLKFNFKKKNLLITYHPVTAVNEDATLDLIEVLKEFEHCGQVITLPNSDPGHDAIIDLFEGYAKERENVFITTSLGSLRYLSVMKVCDVVVGNSSSGITEAPFMGTATLNIGVRQKGRLHDKSVLNSEPSYESIKEKLEECLIIPSESSTLYGDGFSTEKIVNELKNIKFEFKRGFYDL